MDFFTIFGPNEICEADIQYRLNVQECPLKQTCILGNLDDYLHLLLFIKTVKYKSSLGQLKSFL